MAEQTLRASVAEDVEAAIEKLSEPQVIDAAPEPEKVEGKSDDKTQGNRDEQGRFSKKSAEDTPSTQADSIEGAAGEDKPSPEPVETKTESRIPRGLKAHLKAKWAELPAEWQQEIDRIDRAGAHGYEQVKEKVRFADEMGREIAPYEAMIRAEGGSPAGAVRDLLRTAYILRQGSPQQKQTAIMQIVNQFGIPLPQAQEGQEAAPYLPPEIANLANEVQTLRGHIGAQEQSRQAAIESNAVNALNAFLSETDEKGQPRYPLDDSLEGQFVHEIGIVRQQHPDWDNRKVLESAHERLSWTVPELRSMLIARQQAEQESKRRAEEQKAIAAKKNAAGSIRSSSPTSAATAGGDTVRDLIAAQVYGTAARI
jgi:hypothetical protein